MSEAPPLTVTRTGDRVHLAKARWSQTIALADLPARLQLYRCLWARKPGRPFREKPVTPGPWARFYEDDLRVLDAALKDMTP